MAGILIQNACSIDFLFTENLPLALCTFKKNSKVTQTNTIAYIIDLATSGTFATESTNKEIKVIKLIRIFVFPSLKGFVHHNERNHWLFISRIAFIFSPCLIALLIRLTQLTIDE